MNYNFEKNQINYKVLLCACKKYISDQKNGILLVNPGKNDNKQINYEFYDTDKFEVNCFCQIITINNNEGNILPNNEIQSEETEYFLVGGFYLDKRIGAIKLYKLIYDKKEDKIKIDYINDVRYENFKYF